jgi:hypothetical protein
MRDGVPATPPRLAFLQTDRIPRDLKFDFRTRQQAHFLSDAYRDGYLPLGSYTHLWPPLFLLLFALLLRKIPQKVKPSLPLAIPHLLLKIFIENFVEKILDSVNHYN